MKSSPPVLGGRQHRPLALLLAFGFWLTNFCAGDCFAITVPNNTAISEVNTNDDGQDIIVDGAPGTVDGPHSFNSVPLTNNAMPTHTPLLK